MSELQFAEAGSGATDAASVDRAPAAGSVVRVTGELGPRGRAWWSLIWLVGQSLFVPLFLLGLWQVAATRHWLAEQVLPAPSVVLQSIKDLAANGDLWEHARGSLQRVGIGFGIAAVIGIVLGALLGSSRKVEAYVAPLFQGYAQTPVIAWIPIGMMLFGISEKLAIFLITIAAVVPVTMNTFKGVRHIPPAYLELARIYRISRLRLFTEIIVPAALPSIVMGLRWRPSWWASNAAWERSSSSRETCSSWISSSA